jgi:hypothetical protein
MGVELRVKRALGSTESFCRSNGYLGAAMKRMLFRRRARAGP